MAERYPNLRRAQSGKAMSTAPAKPRRDHRFTAYVIAGSAAAAMMAWSIAPLTSPAAPTAEGPAAERQRPAPVYYRNCNAARAAGAAPLRRGEPGYRSQLDRDGDGIACEPYRGR